jgi:hypothetical protein
MNLLFEETKNRQQCGSEVVVNGFKLQCTFSTSKVVTIPNGLLYCDGKLSFSEDTPGSIIPICKNHEMQLNNAFRDLSGETN